MPGIWGVADNYWPRSLTSQLAHDLLGEMRLINIKQKTNKKKRMLQRATRIIQVQRGEKSMKPVFQRESLQEVSL